MMKKARVIFLVIIAIVFSAYIAVVCLEQNAVNKLAVFGQTQFYANDFDAYMGKLCSTEIDDLVGDGTFLRKDYNKDTKTLHLEFSVKSFTSEKIDSYYTQGYDAKGTKLFSVMSDITKKVGPHYYSYTMDNGRTASIYIHGVESLEVSSSEGHVYSYGKRSPWSDEIYVMVDGRDVCCKKENTNSYDSDYTAIMYDKPFVGMSDDYINNTKLGKPDKTELCRDYYALRPDHRSITYRWYNLDGDLIFYAYSLNGEVISVTDYRK